MSRCIRIFRCAFIVVLLCGVYTLPALALTSEEVVSKSKESIVRILIEVKPGDKKLLQHYFKPGRKFDEPVRVKAGTGFVIRADGYILTALHVITPLGQSPKIYVRLPKEGDHLAEVVATDPERQTACIKIKKFDLKPLSLSLEIPKVGSDIFAMGFPFAADTSEISDQELTFTEGKVGALKQSRQESTFIQTNAAINLGNSGGPLIGTDGQVLGVIIGSPDRSLQGVSLMKILDAMFVFGEKDIPVGIGFGTPSKPVIDMLKAAGIEIPAVVTAGTTGVVPPIVTPPGAGKEEPKVEDKSKSGNAMPLLIIGVVVAGALILFALFRKKESAPQEKSPAPPIMPQQAFAKNTTIALGTLLCTEGEYAGRSFTLTEKGLTIGRDDDCDIKLHAEVISRRHSWVGPKGNDIVARDMGSTNGTFVNGKKVEGTQVLQKGDSVSLAKSGQEIFQFTA